MNPVPVLTYHSANISGTDYGSNDHVAFATDLRLIDALGFTIVALVDVVDALLSRRTLPDRGLAITLDDGTDFDYRDLPYPPHGVQRSMLNVMRDFLAETGRARQPSVHATTFVVASPEARAEIDAVRFAGAGWFRDDWWKDAVASGLVAVANHSWDHNHPAVSAAESRDATGTFSAIDSAELADLQIRRAYDFIQARAPNPGASLFAYPYGDTSAFLTEEYLPQGPAITGTRAAFTIQPGHVASGCDRWQLPRYVCGLHWHSPDDLERLLRRG